MVDSIYHTNKRVYSNHLFKQAVTLYEKQKNKEKEDKEKLEILTRQMKEKIRKLQAEKDKLMQEKMQQEKKREEERQAIIQETKEAHVEASHIFHGAEQQMKMTSELARGGAGVYFMTHHMQQFYPFRGW